MIGGLVNLLLDAVIVAFGVVVKRARGLWEPRPSMCTSCKLSEVRGDCSGRCACSVQEMPDDIWAAEAGRGGGNAAGHGAESSSGSTTVDDPQDQPRPCTCPGHLIGHYVDCPEGDGEKPIFSGGPPIPMSEFTLGERWPLGESPALPDDFLARHEMYADIQNRAASQEKRTK